VVDAADEGADLREIDARPKAGDNGALVDDTAGHDGIAKSADARFDRADDAAGRIDDASREAGNIEGIDSNTNRRTRASADCALVGNSSEKAGIAVGEDTRCHRRDRPRVRNTTNGIRVTEEGDTPDLDPLTSRTRQACRKNLATIVDGARKGRDIANEENAS